MYKMKPEYYTGIMSIDQEHARLFQLAEQTHDLLNNDILLDKADGLTSLLSDLIDYARTHFSHEETYMESIHYAQLEAHMAQHRQFEEKLLEFDLDSLVNDYNGQNAAVENLLDFLVNWLTDHIMKADMLYAK